MPKLIYPFDSFHLNPGEINGSDGNENDIRSSMKDILGGKGAGLMQMSRWQFPVPAGFTISTEACREYYREQKKIPDSLKTQMQDALEALKQSKEKHMGHGPLLISVRSGAKFSMPGMMDTILNLGLNDDNVEDLGKITNNRRFAYDSYRRSIQMYGSTVKGIENYLFEEILRDKRVRLGLLKDSDMAAEDIIDVIKLYKQLFEERCGQAFPQDPAEQLHAAVDAVFKSWMTPRAIKYRALNQIPSDIGTAVNIQLMVFGNMGEDSGTGVVFTRDPISGEKCLWGEFLLNAQGEEVVAGTRDPYPVNIAMAKKGGADQRLTLEHLLPSVYQELAAICHKLEERYQDMQDIEFTVQQGKLWILQARNGKRSAEAALKIAKDMVDEGAISIEKALNNIQPSAIERLLHYNIDNKSDYQIIAKGLAASPGAATGLIALTSEKAELLSKSGQLVILVRDETSPEDIAGMSSAQGILTARGGMTSHAAVVARGMGKPCVCSANPMNINYEQGAVSFGEYVIKEGEHVTIDGLSGEVVLGKVPMSKPQLPSSFALVMGWAEKKKKMAIKVNAETIPDIQIAMELGAEGIGLCRTEHMFFEPERITLVRMMILAETEEERRRLADELGKYQTLDFANIMSQVKGLPITIRLLDPPLHEFLPRSEEEVEKYCQASGANPAAVRHRVKQLHEHNPMLGHRGCRVGITYPEIYEMQVRSIFQAMLAIKCDKDHDVEILIPLVIEARELVIIKDLVDSVHRSVANEKGLPLQAINYKFGVMIETPRLALRAADIAHLVDFVSFGTNDLTQTTMGLSRDDSANFLNFYIDKQITVLDPFVSIDKDGVGILVAMAIEKIKRINPNVQIGVCGEHGGDPASIAFFNDLGMDYVSCSPYRIPIARLAAAQAMCKL